MDYIYPRLIKTTVQSTNGVGFGVNINLFILCSISDALGHFYEIVERICQYNEYFVNHIP